jgi:hypothetical protein
MSEIARLIDQHERGNLSRIKLLDLLAEVDYLPVQRSTDWWDVEDGLDVIFSDDTLLELDDGVTLSRLTRTEVRQIRSRISDEGLTTA